MGHIGGWERFVAFIGNPNSDPLITWFVGLQRAEARLILKKKNCFK